MEIFLQSETYISLLTLTVMEIVLGIDNIIFVSILTGRLPKEQQEKGRILGLSLAVAFRVILLFFIFWIVGLVEPLFSIFGFAVSGRDLILIGGGLFLIAKSTIEIHNKLEGAEESSDKKTNASTFGPVIFQIILLDIVFSFDSVITAVGLVQHISVMVIAILISLVVMLVFAKKVSEFIHKHPTLKMLALSFLLMIGLLLLVEGLHVHVPKGYIYFAMAFSVFVEFLNLKMKKKSSEPVILKEKYKD